MPAPAAQKRACKTGTRPATTQETARCSFCPESHDSQLCPRMAETSRRILRKTLNDEGYMDLCMSTPLEELDSAKSAYIEKELLRLDTRTRGIQRTIWKGTQGPRARHTPKGVWERTKQKNVTHNQLVCTVLTDMWLSTNGSPDVLEKWPYTDILPPQTTTPVAPPAPKLMPTPKCRPFGAPHPDAAASAPQAKTSRRRHRSVHTRRHRARTRSRTPRRRRRRTPRREKTRRRSRRRSSYHQTKRTRRGATPSESTDSKATSSDSSSPSVRPTSALPQPPAALRPARSPFSPMPQRQIGPGQATPAQPNQPALVAPVQPMDAKDSDSDAPLRRPPSSEPPESYLRKKRREVPSPSSSEISSPEREGPPTSPANSDCLDQPIQIPASLLQPAERAAAHSTTVTENVQKPAPPRWTWANLKARVTGRTTPG